MMQDGVRRGGAAILVIAMLIAVNACNASTPASPNASGAGASGAPAAAGAQFCSGVNLVFFPGGTQGGGFETVVYSDPAGALKGARVVVSEKSLDKDGNIFAAIVEGPAKGVFAVKRVGEFDITDGAFLPDGDLLLLERAFSMASRSR